MSKYRNYVFTDFECNPDFWKSAVFAYVAYGVEVCPTTGRTHYQGYLRFHNQKSPSAARKAVAPRHVEPMHGSLTENDIYCSKVGSLIEFGERPQSNDNKGRAEKKRWDDIWDAAKRNTIDDIPADVRIRYYGAIKRIAMDYSSRPDPIDKCAGLWIYGPAGAGKTKYVWDTYPGCYIKSRNKWWSGYTGQDVVLLDDVGEVDAKWITDFLKDWGGQYPFQAESKGGGMMIRPKTFIVTSQYSIEDLWTDFQSRDALNRRFEKKQIN